MTSPGPDPTTARWTDLDGEARGSAYDARWEELPAEERHGEADLVWGLLSEVGRATGPPATILDAGCGTGRVAIELAHRGASTIGIDRDAHLLATARAKAPHLRWIEADLVDSGRVIDTRSVDLAVLAGNVMIFVDPGTERTVLGAVASTVRPGGHVVTGFQIRPGGYGPDDLDRDADAVGLGLVDRWATWDRKPWDDHDYQVSVHVVEAVPTG